MKTVLFIDHDFHLLTKSSNFFIDLISSKFKIKYIPVDPSSDFLDTFTMPPGIDGVIIWQLDYLAPFFLHLGYPTIVIPMYDGSSGMPANHWRLMNSAHFISFSFEFYLKLKGICPDNILIKYFPEIPNSSVSNFDKLKAFFWQRRPKELSWEMINHKISSSIEKICIHNVPDSMSDYETIDVPDPQLLQVSTWFENIKELNELLATCNVFIAPRLSEGIGMSFLEAMARGCCVLAYKKSTHDEYICNNVNGILFDLSDQTLDLSDARRLGHTARRFMEIGRKHWLDHDQNAILEAIDKCLSTKVQGNHLSSRFIDDYFHHFFNGFENYCQFLDRNLLLLDGDHSASFALKCSNTISFKANHIRRGDIVRFFNFSKDDKAMWASSAESDLTINLQKLLPLMISIHFLPCENIEGTATLSVYLENSDISITSTLTGDNAIYLVIPQELRSSDSIKIKFVVSGFSSANIDHKSNKSLFGINELRFFRDVAFQSETLAVILKNIELYFNDKQTAIEYIKWSIGAGFSIYQLIDYENFKLNSVFHIIRWAIKTKNLGKFSQYFISKIYRQRIVIPHSVLGELNLHEIHRTIYTLRHDVQRKHNIQNESGIAAYLGWYYIHGAIEFKLESLLLPEEIAWLNQDIYIDPEKSTAISRLEFCLWCFRDDLQSGFDIFKSTDLVSYKQWLSHVNLYEYLEIPCPTYAHRDKPLQLNS